MQGNRFQILLQAFQAAFKSTGSKELQRRWQIILAVIVQL